jgi:hypothetical protein
MIEKLFKKRGKKVIKKFVLLNLTYDYKKNLNKAKKLIFY